MQERELSNTISRAIGPSLLFRSGQLYIEPGEHATRLETLVLDEESITALEAAGICTLGSLHGKTFSDLQAVPGFTVDRYYFLMLSLRAHLQKIHAAEPVSLDSDNIAIQSGSAGELLDSLGEAFWPFWPGIDRDRVLETLGASGGQLDAKYRVATALFFASLIRSPRFEPFALACMSHIGEEQMSLSSFQATVERGLGWSPEPTTSAFRVLLHAIFALQVIDTPDGAIVQLAA